jgi:hypothetical protein
MKRPSCHSIQPMRWGKIYQPFMLGYKPITLSIVAPSTKYRFLQGLRYHS